MFDVKIRLQVGMNGFARDFSGDVLLRGCGTGISFVKILRARDNNFEGSECSLRALGAKRRLRQVKSNEVADNIFFVSA